MSAITSFAVPVLIAVTLGFIFKRFITKKRGEDLSDFRKVLEEEQEANFTRAREIPKDFLIVPNVSFLSDATFRNANLSLEPENIASLERAEKMIMDKAVKPMAKLPSYMTNIEIKKAFGANNLDKIAMYEGYFYEYIHSINTYANLLLKFNLVENAEIVLKHGIYDMKSDIAKSYTDLIHLYNDKNEKSKLDKLISDIKTMVTDQNLQDKILNNAVS